MKNIAISYLGNPFLKTDAPVFVNTFTDGGNFLRPSRSSFRLPSEITLFSGTESVRLHKAECRVVLPLSAESCNSAWLVDGLASVWTAEAVLPAPTNYFRPRLAKKVKTGCKQTQVGHLRFARGPWKCVRIFNQSEVHAGSASKQRSRQQPRSATIKNITCPSFLFGIIQRCEKQPFM